MYTSCIGELGMARQISVSNEVYELLLKKKGKKSFSEVIKENLLSKEKKAELMSLAGILKDDKTELKQLKSQIAVEREKNYGSKF
jgi:predicted CopG family antitoxin